MDSELLNETITVERKKFYFYLNENIRGRFLKITEEVSGRRDTIIVPAPGLAAFCEVLRKAEALGPGPEGLPPEIKTVDTQGTLDGRAHGAR